MAEPPAPAKPARKRGDEAGEGQRAEAARTDVPKAAGSNRFPIVAIGASAGGLETLEQFLSTAKAPLIDEQGGCDRILGVATDITARKEAEAALHEADRLKNEFLAMLGHELRNPLVPIRNAAYVIGRLESDEPTLKWAHALIERQVSHLTWMVDDLLELSRILSGKVKLQRTRVELAWIVA